MENNQKKIPCTVEILTFNSEKTVSRTLESVKDFAEVIIIDGGSTDKTLEIVRGFGCVILSQDEKFKNENGSIKNYSGVRNQGLSAAKYAWFAFVDSDEYFTPSLVEEIRAIVDVNIPKAYWVPRKYVMNGEVIDCASTYPSRQMRFFHKDATEGFAKEVHERVQLKPGAPVEILKNFMCVPIDDNLENSRRKQDKYIKMDVARFKDISFGKYISMLIRNTEIAALYFFRTVRNCVFCRGNRMPFRYEMDRLVYYFKLSWALSKKIKRKK